MTSNLNIILSDSAKSRLQEVMAKAENGKKFLRIGVSSGGCSGFQYLFNLVENLSDDDIKLYEDNGKLLATVDEAALPFLDGCVVDFVKDLGASYFKVNNPNAAASCGCGASFSV